MAGIEEVELVSGEHLQMSNMPEPVQKVFVFNYGPAGEFQLEVHMPIPDWQRIPKDAWCRICPGDVAVGTFSADEVPLMPVGEWRCAKGHQVMLANKYTVKDTITGRTLVAYAPRQRHRITTTLTEAQALSILVAAQGVMEQNGSTAALGEALRKAPAPIRNLRTKSKMTRAEWISIASIVASVIIGVLPMLHDDGGVSEEQLVEIVKTISDSQLHQPGDPYSNQEDPRNESGTTEHSTPERSGPPPDQK